MKLSEQIGNRIRDLRQKNGISQEKLALMAGIQRSYMGAIERGEKNISVIYLYKICKELGVTMSEFFKEIK